MPRILLINPKTVNRYYHVSGANLFDRVLSWFFQKRYDKHFTIPSHAHCTSMPPVTLLGLQALFRDRCDVEVLDEQVASIDFDAKVSLVGITATTPQAPRAIEIARQFRARGIRTAVGGVHATCRPHECARHFDTVCVGEAEGYIHEMLDDLDRGQLKPRYTNRRFIPMSEVPFYDYDICGGRYLPFHVISFSRGCVFNCEFCSIRSTLGEFRSRSIPDVIRRIETVGSKNLWFTDATLTANPQQARALFKALAPLKVRWLGQVTMNMVHDRAMLDLMAESGCWLAGIGFESLSAGSLKSVHKMQNRVEDYARMVRELHSRNIAIDGNFVFGFDEDHDDVFDATADFALRTGIDFPDFYVLTPYPDTALFQRLNAAGRIVDYDWSHYDNAHFTHRPVFQPRHMSRETLHQGCLRAERRVYSIRGTLRRLVNSRVRHATVWIANAVYARRLATQGNLAPFDEELPNCDTPLAQT
ncbi:MAG: B12-binding domain-containing radical SAM protein [Pirellulaceae bacterium]